MSIGDFVVCPNCNGKGGYHNYPCSGFVPPAFYAPPPPGERTGAVPAKFVTADDVRRIVREEIAQWMANQPGSSNP